MKIQLTSCGAARPDKRAIANMLETYADDMSAGEAREQTEFLLEGSPIDIEVSGNEGSAYRAFRKLDIEYEIME